MTNKNERRTKEDEVQYELLRLMSNTHLWTNAGLKNALNKSGLLTQADRAASKSRPNEEKWENLVNNALSESRGSSLIAKGWVESFGRGEHKITEKGLRVANARKKFAKRLEDSGSFQKLDKILNDWPLPDADEGKR